MFKPHPKAEQRTLSASLLIKHVLSGRSADVLEVHIRELLDTMLWKITEANGKYTARCQSQGAMELGVNLQHKHVFQKKQMINRLMTAPIDEIDRILADACCCVVTRQEHERLKPFDNEYGRERYRKAGIIVIDKQTGERIVG